MGFIKQLEHRFAAKGQNLLSRALVISVSCAFFSCSFTPAVQTTANLPQPELQANAASDNQLFDQGIEHRPEVKEQIDHFTKRDHRFIPLAMKRARPFYREIENLLKQEGLPPELINIALIESGFRVDARGRVKVLGIWQLAPHTARRYNLLVGKKSDQRRDPLLSTKAALSYLKYLYTFFNNDWHLAIAAYNAGEGRIGRALKGSGQSDFWSLRRKGAIPKITAQYVPRFIAVSLILRDPQRYGLDLSI